MDWTPLIAGFVGVLIGSVTSIITVYMQHRSEVKRDRVRLAVEAAMADYKSVIEMSQRSSRDTEIPPLSAYIHFHAAFLQLVADNRLSAESMADLFREQEAVMNAARKLSDRLNPPKRPS